jgi:hypothetical protein
MNQELDLLRDELELVLGGLDEQQTQLRPLNCPDKWSIQQIVGHLVLTYEATVAAVDARIAKAAITKAKPSMVQRVGQFTLLRVGYFPRGRRAPDRVTAPANAAAVPSGILIAEVNAAIGELDRRVAVGEKIFGCKQRSISHMILGPLSIDQWRRFHLIHGRHHIRQIVTIRRQHGI